ncbi:MAG: hypothetical protein K0R13_3435, partial [Propionibacteriaceae bacterium]|nr:hypothetical protein [Propionibacteriaceae bacterium]
MAFHDDAARNVKPEAGSLTDILGREERLERASRHLRRHARAGVPNVDHDVAILDPRRHMQR